MNLRSFVLLCALLLVCLSSSYGQGYIYATGTPTNATTLPIDRGFVNVNNGEIHLEIPIATKAQRGAFSLQEKLVYDSRIWKIVQNGTTSSWQPTNVAGGWGGWTFSSSQGGSGVLTNTVTPGVNSHPPGCASGYTQNYNQYSNWTWTDANQTVHSFPGAYTVQYTGPLSGHCPTLAPGVSTSSSYASDGSGYQIQIANYTHATITSSQGVTYTPQITGSSAVDSNGNYMSTDGSGNVVDTGNIIPVAVSSSGIHTYYDVLPVGGGSRQRYTVTTTTVAYSTQFGQSGVGDVSGSFTAVQSIALPDGSSYQFTYDSGTAAGHYGELTGMTLPTGGAVSYAYANNVDPFLNQNMWITSLTRDGATTSFSMATESFCASGEGCQQQTTVTSPDGNASVYTFSIDSAGFAAGESWIQNVGNALTSTGTTYTYTTYPVTTDQSGTLSVTSYYRMPASQTTLTWLSDINYASNTTTTFVPGTMMPSEVKSWDFYNAGGYPLTTDTLYQYAGCSRPASVIVNDASGNQISKTTYGYDETTPKPTSGVPQHLTGSNKCNLTSQHQWINTTGKTLDVTMTYDDTGALLTSTDPNGTTTYGHDSTDTFVTSTTLPTPSSGVTLTSSATYDASTGVPLSQTDPNGAKVLYLNYDAFNRPAEIDTQDGGGNMVGKSTYMYYSPTNSGFRQYQNATAYADVETMYDGYGRLSRTATFNGQSGNAWYQQDTCYDSNGRPSFQSYAYQGNGWSTTKVCSGSSAGVATTYDPLGRTRSLTNADGTIQYFYTGRAVKTVDVNNVQTIRQSDAFGRTTAVCELSSNSLPGSGGTPGSCPTDISGTGFATTYAYDLANHKTVVSQGSQVRTFQTDSLNRPVLSAEPEWGATASSPLQGATNFSYVYNGTGLAVTRTRPQANQSSATVLTTTTTQYDTLGRPITINYNDGTPTRTYIYDQTHAFGDPNNFGLGYSKGRLTRQMVNAGNGMGSVFGYDPVGRVTLMETCRASTCGHAADLTQYTYDWAGNQTSASNPVGTITYGRSAAGEISSISSSYQATNNPGTLVSNVVNGPNGPISYSYGNGLSQYNVYDNIGRLQGGWVCQNSPSPSFGCGQQPQTYGFYKNQKGSQISTGWDDITGQNTTYGYDEFNRLSSSNYGNGAQTFNYTYDRYGNRWQQNAPQGGPAPMFSFSQANNHADQLQYDAAGNVTNDGVHTYTYDAEGNQIGVDNNQTSQTFYDAMNRRVWIHTSGNSSINEPAFQEIDYDVNGQRLSTWDGASGNLMQAQVYWGSMPLAYYKEGAIHFQHQDWVGSERVTTSATGSTEMAAGNYPFGDGLAPSGRDIDPYHYAGLDHNNESGNERAQFRELSSRQGHWMSPDPYSGSYDAGNPQSFNRYSYVLNNPLTFTDSSGLDCVVGEGGIGTESCDRTPGCDYGCVDQNSNTYQYIGNAIGDGSGDTVDAVDGDPHYVPTQNGTGGYYLFGAIPAGYIYSGPTGSAPSNTTCTTQALLSGAGSIALDSIGLIPEAEGFLKVFENTAGYQLARAAGNAAGYRGVVATQYGMKAVAQGKGGAALVSGAFGLGDTSVQGRLSTGLTVAGFVPGLGTLAAGASIVNDAIKTGMAVAKCP